MTPSEQGLVAPSDIAEMARVSRGAVSNWRKRSDDFPEQVGGTPAKPLFSREAVNAWLTGRGYEIRQDRGETHVWSALNEMRGVVPADEMAEVVLSLACARKLSDESVVSVSPWTRILQSVSGGFHVVAQVRDEMATHDPRWAQLVPISDALLRSPGPVSNRVIGALDNVDSDDLSVVADYALNRLANAQIRSGAEHGFVGSRISRLLGNIVTVASDGVLYDPACGLASAVTAAVDAGAHPTRFVGHDINAAALRMAAQRCYLRGIDIELSQTDVLTGDVDSDLRADVIVLEPPFGLRWIASDSLVDPRWEFGLPPRSSADMAWIQHAVAHLSDEGRAYVVTSMGSLFRGGSEKAIRTELVRRGCVEAVFGLPGKMLPHVSIPLALWVLCRPGAANNPDEILLVDGSEVIVPENKAADWLRLPAEVADAPAWRSVLIRDLLATEADLTPQRWIAVAVPDPREVTAAYLDGWKAINASFDHVQERRRTLQRISAVPSARVLTIGELVDQGLLEIKAGRPRDRGNELSADLARRVVTAADVRDGSLTDIDDPVQAQTDDADLTRAGDVLVTTMHKIRARVDETGGHLPSTGVYRLRITNPDQQLSPEYLALVLTGSWNDRFQAGSTIQRAAIRNLEVPLVPLGDQTDLQTAIGAVRHLAEEAQTLADNAHAVGTALLDAVRYKAPLHEGNGPSVRGPRPDSDDIVNEGMK